MKRFDFRLQRVIEVRELKKKERQRELARSQEELKRQTILWEEAMTQHDSSQEGLRQALKKRCSAGLLTTLERCRGHQEAHVQRQVKAMAEHRQVVDEKRANLIAAAKEKEVLVRLKEKAWEEHMHECQGEEQAFLDELGCRIGRTWKYSKDEKRGE